MCKIVMRKMVQTWLSHGADLMERYHQPLPGDSLSCKLPVNTQGVRESIAVKFFPLQTPHQPTSEQTVQTDFSARHELISLPRKRANKIQSLRLSSLSPLSLLL